MERERNVLGTLIVVLLVLWVGFAVHRSPRFPGSLTGGMLAISGATLMVVFSLAYMAVKRIPSLKQRINQHLSIGRLLKWHVYTGALGAVLAILHTGHRFESDLGIALTASMLITVLSGYVGRHLLARVSMDLREKRDELAKLETAYNETIGEISRTAAPALASAASSSNLSWFSLWSMRRLASTEAGTLSSPYRAVRMAESIAELEYSVRFHEHFKRLASLWLKVHIAFSLAFYALLGVHIWASIHFGLRWFD